MFYRCLFWHYHQSHCVAIARVIAIAAVLVHIARVIVIAIVFIDIAKHIFIFTIFIIIASVIFHYDDVIMTMLASQITSLTIVYSIVYSGVNQRKHQSSASLAIVREIHRGPVNFPHKWPVTRKMFPFDDVIMRCHYPHYHCRLFPFPLSLLSLPVWLSL